MPHWIWEDANWPHFTWDEAQLSPLVVHARKAQGQLLGRCSTLTESLTLEAQSAILTEDAVDTSAIEGEIINRASVRSSLAEKLGLENAGVAKSDRYIDGLLDMLLDATTHYQQPLTLERLCGWHAALFPTGYSGIRKIPVGRLRDESPMFIVSGPLGKETIHYEAPKHNQLKKEMNRFLKWFNTTSQDIDGLIRAGIAHYWFVAIHPFADGNGRLTRTITDMALAQDDKAPKRFYSLSMQILNERKKYYAILEKTSSGKMNITPWLKWFIECFHRAIKNSESIIHNVLLKSAFWQTHAQTELNTRQKKVLNKLLDAGPGNFIGDLSTRKYCAITKTSRATASREINDLVKKGCIKPIPHQHGRNVAYEIVYSEFSFDSSSR